MRTVLRVIIDRVVEGAIKRLDARARLDEAVANREYFQHYGYTSRPLPGAEGLLVREGGVVYMVASDDRRYRVAIEDGEVCLYTDEGDKIHFHRNRIIEIVGGAKVVINTTEAEVNASASTTINTPLAVVNATTSATVNSPAINLGGERGGMRKMIDERLKAVFDDHVHTGVEPGGGNSGPPSAALVLDSVATDVTRGI